MTGEGAVERDWAAIEAAAVAAWERWAHLPRDQFSAVLARLVVAAMQEYERQGVPLEGGRSVQTTVPVSIDGELITTVIARGNQQSADRGGR